MNVAVNYQIPQTKQMYAFREFYQDRLTESPNRFKLKGKTKRSKHLGWVFLAEEVGHKPTPVRTYLVQINIKLVEWAFILKG